MKTVLLVGAGATLAEAIPKKPSLKKTPPLDATFFERCKLVFPSILRSTKSYLKTSYGIDVDAGASSYRMEEVFNYLYSDAMRSDASEEAVEAYSSLTRAYMRVIGETTDWLSGTSRSGVGALLKGLFKNDPQLDLSIITFNQDLVIEKAVEQMVSLQEYSTIDWDIEEAYGIRFQLTQELSGSDSDPFESGSGVSIPILKLHGSLNWFYRVRSGADPKNAVRQPPAGRLLCLNDKAIRRQLVIGSGPARRDLIPFVVPPIYEKAARYQQVIEPAWAEARRRLQQANRLIIFGYSFPETDFAARSLFKASFVQNHDLEVVHVIDPSPAMAARVVELCGDGFVGHCHSVEAFRRLVLRV